MVGVELCARRHRGFARVFHDPFDRVLLHLLADLFFDLAHSRRNLRALALVMAGLAAQAPSSLRRRKRRPTSIVGWGPWQQWANGEVIYLVEVNVGCSTVLLVYNAVGVLANVSPGRVVLISRCIYERRYCSLRLPPASRSTFFVL